jgi:DNA repair exonuclease SbcCD ATPase subunit
MTSPATVDGGRQATWTRESIIERIRRWAELYGEPPRAADWNPSSAKWSGSEWRVPRYRAGDPETGQPWPSLNAAKKHFDGSLNAAVIAAGFPPNKPGPPSRTEARAPGGEDRLVMSPAARVLLDGAHAEVDRLTEKLAIRDRQLESVRTRAARAQYDLRLAEGRAQTMERPVTQVVRVVDPAKPARVPSEQLRIARVRATKAQERARRASLRLDEVKVELREQVKASRKLEARLAKADEATDELRREAEELRAAVARAEDRAVVAERSVREVVVESATAADVEKANRRARDAELRTAAAERRMRDMAVSVTGERRLLTDAELTELRGRGPTGPGVMSRALKRLAAARAEGGNVPLRAALTEVASAAIRWRDGLR